MTTVDANYHLINVPAYLACAPVLGILAAISQHFGFNGLASHKRSQVLPDFVASARLAPTDALNTQL